MRKSIAIGALGLAVAAAVGVAASQALAHQSQRQGQGSVLWAERYNGPGKLGDEASSVAVSPDGKTVVVTGLSTGAGGRKDYATIAYSAATGARLWVSRYGGPGGAQASPSALAISPSGNEVLVTGRAPGPSGGPRDDYVTVAYELASGRQSLAVSPTTRAVYVTGYLGTYYKMNFDYLTIAYRG
jgi:DNA-binding beta-propeller fold protein YncE